MILSLNKDNFYRSNSRWKVWFDSRCKNCDKKRKNNPEYKKQKNYKKRIIELYDWYVYVLESGWYYKIGVTIHNDVKKRINAMMHWNPLDINAVMINKSKWDMFSEEKFFHKAFESKRIRWEWFLLTQSDLEYIKKFYA